jgi:membrane-associated phospholipid phosphatase
LKDIVQNNKVLFALLSLYLISGLFLLFFEKGEIELFVNRHHNIYYDVFFSFVTRLGDGGVLLLIILAMSFRKIYYGILGLLTFLASTIIVQSLKRIIFYEYPRPSKFFEKYLDLHYVEGIELHSFFSFPSGHSSGAFSVFILLALISKNSLSAILFFLIALLVSFSRIYLMQHFFIDTYVGAFIGILTTALIYYFVGYRTNWNERPKFKQPLQTLFYKK